MPRYIDADALKSALENNPSDFYDYDELIPLIDAQPTVSPDEVRGVGKWTRISGFHLDHEYYPARYQCDQCGHFVDSGDDKNYCPNCGAKMEPPKEETE